MMLAVGGRQYVGQEGVVTRRNMLARSPFLADTERGWIAVGKSASWCTGRAPTDTKYREERIHPQQNMETFYLNPEGT